MMAHLPPQGDIFSHNHNPIPWLDQDYYNTRPTDSPDTVEHLFSPFSNPSALNSVDTLALNHISRPATPRRHHQDEEVDPVSPFSRFHHPDPFQQTAPTPSEARAQSFLQAFLSAHPLSQGNPGGGAVSVIPDAVPTMEELESWGGLSEEEGTRRCRRMFKAPVIWDELGHAAWKMLRRRKEERERRVADLEPVRRVDASMPEGVSRSSSSNMDVSLCKIRGEPRDDGAGGSRTLTPEGSPAHSRRGSLSMCRRIPGANAFKSQSWSASSDGRQRRERGSMKSPIRKVPSAPEVGLEASDCQLQGPKRLSRLSAQESSRHREECYGYRRERRPTIPRMINKCSDIVRRVFGESS